MCAALNGTNLPDPSPWRRQIDIHYKKGNGKTSKKASSPTRDLSHTNHKRVAFQQRSHERGLLIAASSLQTLSLTDSHVRPLPLYWSENSPISSLHSLVTVVVSINHEAFNRSVKNEYPSHLSNLAYWLRLYFLLMSRYVKSDICCLYHSPIFSDSDQ